MKIQKIILISFVLMVSFVACSKKETTPENIEVQEFIWKGLNAYYLWQGEIEDLSDRRFSSEQQLFSYLAGFNDPRVLFESLLYEPGVTDKWSWIVDDYVALEQSLQGTSSSTGMEFGLVAYRSQADKIFGYVRYVLPNTDAADKGVTRGMLFSEVNGTQLTRQNYRELLFSASGAYTIHLADYSTGNPIANGSTISLTKSEYTENPIHVVKTLDIGGEKIGYLMYNRFTSGFDSQLNQAFAQLKADNVSNLVVDLRYNGGGSVRSATHLGSMITGQFSNDIFTKQRWNEKVMNAVNSESLIERFVSKLPNEETINSLNLSKVYFITTGSTASASELVMIGLLPHIDVQSVGTRTVGKYVGSLTLYDSPSFYSKTDINPNHNYAMQPIALELVNKANYNDKDGIDPTVELSENYGDLGVLGDENEPLLKRTIELITTGSRSIQNKQIPGYRLETIMDSKGFSPTFNNMYVDIK